MKLRRIISALLVIALVFTIAIPCEASGTHFSAKKEELFAGGVFQEKFTTESTAGYYKITATETKYYKFTFDNQSVEIRTGISIADSFLNLFLGKISIEITDEYDLMLAEFSVKCGYSGNVSLKLQEGSTYYIKVTSNFSGNYRIKVDAYADIGGDNWSNATETLSVGQLISSIDASGDKDWFYFQTDDTDSFYDFSLENISGSSNMHMYVYEYVEGAGQEPLRSIFNISAYSSNTASKQLRLNANSKYYVCIYLNSGIGGYQLDITQTIDAVGSAQENSYQVETDTKVTTAIDGKGDVDWFQFTTKEYEAYYYFNVENLSINNQYYLAVYDAEGNELKSASAYSSYDLTTNIKLLPNTEYYFKISSTSSGTGNYNFIITDIPDNYANEQENAGEIQLDEEISASVSGNGDVDWFQFTTTEYDAYYYFDIENLSINNQYYLAVYDAEGNELKSASAYSSYDLTTNIKLLPNTEYYFKLNSTSSGTGNYRVKVTSQDDFYPNSQEEAKEISLNQKVSASITGNGDIDFFKFTTESFDAYYYFDIENLSINNQYYLTVYDAEGNELKSASAYSSYDLTTNIKLLPNAEYCFGIKSTSSGTGKYKVTVSYVADEEGDVKEKATEISINETNERELSSDNDVDWFKFTLQNDCNVRVIYVSESGVSQKVILYSSTNRELINCNCYSSSGIEKTKILDAGTYYIKVTGNAGFYTLAVGNCGSAHVEGSRYVAASTTADGIKTTYCKSCKKVIKKEIIPRIDKVSLSYTKATYSGSQKKPTVTVYDVKGNKISSSQYTVTYSSGRVNVGTYSVKVSFKGQYTGTKTVNFKIVPVASSKLKLKLSTTSYTYNGKTKKPTVSVKNASGKTVSSAYYTVTYPSGRKYVGTYKVKVTFKGNYSGTQYLSFKINPVKTPVKKLTAGKKSLKVYVTKKSSQVTGYQVQYSTSKKFKSAKTKTLTSYKTTSTTLTKLSKKKTYYVRVRTYKTVKGVKYYSGWSTYKSAKTK